jgi:biopolymer transport protein ExbD
LVFFLLTSPAITPDALDLILPKANGKTSNVQKASVSITKDGAYYVNKERVSEYSLEKELKSALSGQEEPTVILRAEEGVPIEDAVFVMDIANKNNFKVVLAVRPN